MADSVSTDKRKTEDAIKTGRELSDDFFLGLPQLEGVDTEIAKMMQQLYASDQLTAEAVARGLAEMRGKRHD